MAPHHTQLLQCHCDTNKRQRQVCTFIFVRRGHHPHYQFLPCCRHLRRRHRYHVVVITVVVLVIVDTAIVGVAIVILVAVAVATLSDAVVDYDFHHTRFTSLLLVISPPHQAQFTPSSISQSCFPVVKC